MKPANADLRSVLPTARHLTFVWLRNSGQTVPRIAGPLAQE